MSSQLCVNCQEIPFDPELETLSLAKPDQEWHLGVFGEVRRRKCPFCQLVSSMCWSGSLSGGSVKPMPENEKIVVTFGGDAGFWVSPGSSASTICIAVDPANDKEPETRVYRARETLDEWIDFDVVIDWISTCEHTHGTECVFPTYNPAAMPRNPGGQPIDFRLIDVEAMCIVYAPRYCRYIALSYVWGDANDGRLVLDQDNEDSLMQPGAFRGVQASIPNTILDAMAVVRRLRERYLWVDSLCLVQDDMDELHECTAVMDLFYEMAIFTIIAGNGSDAHVGLPGVRPRPRKISRLVREVVPGLRMTTALGTDDLLRKSYYSTRAWT